MTETSTEEKKRNIKFNQQRLELGEDSRKQKQSWQEGKGEMLRVGASRPTPVSLIPLERSGNLRGEGKEWKFLTYSERLVCGRSRKD